VVESGAEVPRTTGNDPSRPVLGDMLARVVRASEALLDGDSTLAAQILDDLVVDLSRTLAFPGCS
jgi:hypothetical protein